MQLAHHSYMHVINPLSEAHQQEHADKTSYQNGNREAIEADNEATTRHGPANLEPD